MSKKTELKNADVRLQFQTPPSVCRHMASMIPDGAVRILEPTPGIGNLANAIKRRGTYDLWTPEDFFCFDRSQMEFEFRFDCIVMNPPFSAKFAYNVPDHLQKYGMRLGYYILLSCMRWSDNIIALMPWFTISDSDLRLNTLKNWGIKSITALPRSTFAYIRVQTMIIEMEKDFSDETIMKVFQPRHKQQLKMSNPMPKKQSYITVTDQFCGAGGSSQGVRAMAGRYNGGLEVKIALNHWKLAIETHNTNFPDTAHDCTDISACDPRRYPSTDILITSPECTNHSLAKGVKIAQKQIELFDQGKLDPAAERSRATMWDVCRFAEYHAYNAIIVENVVDARKWVLFDAWLTAMRALGYEHRCVYLNSMHMHPTPQSRDRMYIVFWKKGNKAPQLDYMPKAWCARCACDVQAVQTWKNPLKRSGKYRQQYVYCCPVDGSRVEPYFHAAFNCIDWSDIGKRIGDRSKPLSDNTIKRIRYGLKKYGRQPMQIVNYSPGYAKPLSDATGTMTTNDHHGLLTPFILHSMYGKEARGVVRDVISPAFTQVTMPTQAVVMPFVFKAEHSHAAESGKVKSTADSFQTQTTRQSMGMVIPYIIEMNRTGEANPAIEPCATMTAGGINHAMLTPPFIPVARGKSMAHSSADPVSTQSQMINHGIVTTEAFNSFIASYYNGSDCTKHVSQECGTVTTNDRSGLVTYQEPVLEDCYYRMLKPHEIKLAMAFDKDYTVLGSGRDQVKQLGNAVTPPVMEWLVGQVIESFN